MGAQEDTRLLVVTDLDGTLLDHDDYGWEPARGSLRELRRRGFPVVLCSSKTVAELVPLAAELRTEAPLIAENGAAVGVPECSPLAAGFVSDRISGGYLVRVVGPDREAILSLAHQLRNERGFRFAGFADWTAGEVARRTGLAPGAAQLARQRWATEPIAWEDTPSRWEEFLVELRRSGLRAVRGGRFTHLMGETDKAGGLELVAGLYRGAFPGVRWRSVALGDSDNDLAMLAAADSAVVIPRPDGSRVAPATDRFVVAGYPGPRGWDEAMTAILKDFD